MGIPDTAANIRHAARCSLRAFSARICAVFASIRACSTSARPTSSCSEEQFAGVDTLFADADESVGKLEFLLCDEHVVELNSHVIDYTQTLDFSFLFSFSNFLCRNRRFSLSLCPNTISWPITPPCWPA